MIIPVLVAATYERFGETRTHHVVEERADEFPHLPVRELCAEHLVDSCANCGRSPGVHDEDAARIPKDHPAYCGKHVARKKCECEVERWSP